MTLEASLVRIKPDMMKSQSNVLAIKNQHESIIISFSKIRAIARIIKNFDHSDSDFGRYGRGSLTLALFVYQKFKKTISSNSNSKKI